MPAAIPPIYSLAQPSWRQQRQSSTAQESKLVQDTERVSAILHGRLRDWDSSRGQESSSTTSRNRISQPSLPTRRDTHLKPQQAQRSTTHQSPPRSGHKQQIIQKRSRIQRAPVMAKKRKIADPATQPKLKDEAYIRSTMHVPTPHDYPNLPHNFFKNLRESVHNALQGLAKLEIDIKPLANDVFQATLQFISSADDEVAIGEGRSKVAASEAAYLHLVAKFHQRGILSDVLDRGSTMNRINKRSLEEAKSAIIDIYNYAARFDTVPRVHSKSLIRVERKRPRKYIQVTLELPEQNIEVTASGKDAEEAESRAALLFKREAEKHHAERGSEAIIIKDSGALTTDKASTFFDFYRALRPGVNFRCETLEKTEARSLKSNHSRVQVRMDGEPLGEVVEMIGKRLAEDTAWLTAAIALKKREPDLYPRYLEALRSGNGQILKPITPVDMLVDEDCSLVMRETLLGARKAGLPDEVDELAPDISVSEAQRAEFRRRLNANQARKRNEELQEKLGADLQNPDFEELRRKKAELPMNQYKAKVIDLVNNNVYSIIVGATGSGKTTQVPQILLEDYITRGLGSACNIICTQPRRIAATSVARRVADERFEKLQDSVGYQVRFDARLPRQSGSITYCTTGVLQQQLQHMPDVVMDHVSHLVIDEVHERDMLIDFLLILLKKTVKRRLAQGRPVPKVVLMSATLDIELFASYFKSDFAGKGTVECPSLSVPGRAFPVREKYLDEVIKEMTAASPTSKLAVMHADPNSKDFLEVEDSFRLENQTTPSQQMSNLSRDEVSVIDWKRERKLSADGAVVVSNSKEKAVIPFGLTACTIAHIAKTTREGGILVFFPGLEEMVKVNKLLEGQDLGVNFNDDSKFRIYLLHSSISQSQNTVFDAVPDGCRKIILATNIAETSVTIPDVQYVVDTGRQREKQYDQSRRISELVCTWISKSNAKQRAGRAGRVQNGNYYALYTKERYESLRAIGLPELLRIDLQEVCLKVKAQAFRTPIRDFLAEAIEAPSASSVDKSVMNLQDLDALTDDEEITPLGRLLSSLPVHPSLGKMIVLGIIFRCLDPMLILGAASGERDLFLNPLNFRKEAREAKLSFVQGSGSDHIALLNAVRDLRRLRDEDYAGESMQSFASRNFLHINTFKVIDATAKQIEELLVDAGLIPHTPIHQRLESQYGEPSLNQNSNKVPLIKALALAGVRPNLAINTGGRLFRTRGEKNAMLHPSSVNAARERKDEQHFERGALFSYSAMSRSNDGGSLFLRDTTQSTPLMATLFGGKLSRQHQWGKIIEVDRWLPFYVQSSDPRTPKTIIEFRKALERLLTTTFEDLGRLSRQRVGTTAAPLAGAPRPNGSRMAPQSIPAEPSQHQYLADDKARAIFASGLVDVLDRDVKTTEAIAQRGWDYRNYGDERRQRRSSMDGRGRTMASGRTDGKRSSADRALSKKRVADFMDMMKI